MCVHTHLCVRARACEHSHTCVCLCASAPAITGMDADSIRDQLDYNEDMTFIELTDEEIDQVVAYLSFLDH